MSHKSPAIPSYPLLVLSIIGYGVAAYLCARDGHRWLVALWAIMMFLSSFMFGAKIERDRARLEARARRGE